MGAPPSRSPQGQANRGDCSGRDERLLERPRANGTVMKVGLSGGTPITLASTASGNGGASRVGRGCDEHLLSVLLR